MPLTQGQITTFFTDANYLGIAPETQAQLILEGMDAVDDLAKFDKRSIEQMASSFRRMQPVVPFGAKSLKRLTKAVNLIKF